MKNIESSDVMQSNHRVIVYSKIYELTKRKLNEKRIDSASVGSIENYDLIIICPGALESMKEHSRREELMIRTRDIRNVLERGSHVCILNSDINDPLITEFYSLFSFRYIKGVKEIQEINTKRSEFDTFIRNNAIAFGFFPSWFLTT